MSRKVFPPRIIAFCHDVLGLMCTLVARHPSVGEPRLTPESSNTICAFLCRRGARRRLNEEIPDCLPRQPRFKGVLNFRARCPDHGILWSTPTHEMSDK